MRAINHNIKLNFSGIIQSFPAIIDSKVFDISSDRYMMLPASRVLITVPNNADAKDIDLNQRIIKMGAAWKMIGIDRTRKGLFVLHYSCSLDFVTN